MSNSNTWCLWLRDSPYEVVPLTLFRITYFLLYILWQVVALLIAIATAIATVISELYSLLPVLFFTFFAFVWWLYYPDLQPFISTTGVQILNLGLLLFQLFWNLLIILWNLFVLVWNAAAPIIGMIIYVALEVFTKLLTAVVKLLGEIDVYALFRPFIEILEVITRMLVEVIQALVSAAIGLLQALAKIIGALITILVSVVKILFPIVKWIVGLLFKLLFPVLKVVISIVSWFLNLFSASRMQRNLQHYTDIKDIEAAYLRIAQMRSKLEEYGSSMPLFSGRQPLGFADVDIDNDVYSQGWGSLHDTMYPAVNWAASRHFSNSDYTHAADTEIQVMLRIMDEIQLRSFSYYWYVNRPYLQGIDGGAMPSEVYTGEVGTSQDVRAVDPAYMQFVPRAPVRSLLEFGTKRNILSAEDKAVLEEPEPVTINEYWKRLDSADAREDVLAWYSHQHYSHQQKRQHAMNRLREGIRTTRFSSEQEYYATYDDSDGQTNKPELSYEDYTNLQADIDDADRMNLGLPLASKRRHPFADELDGRHACKRLACGGKGHTLPHAVHSIRKLSHRRQQRMDSMSWKPMDMTEEEYQKSKTVHIHVLGHATNEALDKLKWHLQDPVLHQHAKTAWKRITGYDGVGDALDAYHATYSNAGEWMMNRIGSLSDWQAFRWLAESDPEFDKRPWFGDWARRKTGTEDGSGKWHSRKLQALGPDMSAHRQLLELEDPYAKDEWINQEPSSDIDEIFADGIGVKELTYFPKIEYVRQILGFPLPLPDVPDVYQQQQDAADRQGSINADKPHENAILPLFKLLTETDCYTTHPRNPLCLPVIPESWQIKTAPQVKWPENATADDGFCAPTFKLIKRCFTCWDSWINWRWWYNALQIPRLILSSIPVFTDTLYHLGQTYPFLKWLFRLPLALPPGHTPTALDWICAAIYGPYALAFTYLTFKVLSLLYPVALVIIQALMGGWGLNMQWVEANTAYYQAMQERETLAIQMALKDSPANPSLAIPGNYRGDPSYLHGGPGRMAPSHLATYGADKNMMVDNNPSRYAAGVLGRQFNGPYNPTMNGNPSLHMQMNSPYTYDRETGAPTYAGFPSTSVPAVKPNTANTPQQKEQPPPTEEEERAATEAREARARAEAEREAELARQRHNAHIAQTHREQLESLRVELSRAFMEVGIPNLDGTTAERLGPEHSNIFRHAWECFCDDRVSKPEMAAFERFYHVLLMPYQHSYIWQRQYQHHYGHKGFWKRHERHPELGGAYVHHFLPPQNGARPEDLALAATLDDQRRQEATAAAAMSNDGTV